MLTTTNYVNNSRFLLLLQQITPSFLRLFNNNNSYRKFSTTKFCLKFKRLPRSLMFVRPDKVTVDKQVAQKLDAEQFAYRKHIGICNVGAVSPPRAYERAFVKCSADSVGDLNSLKLAARQMSEHLAHRQTPSDERTSSAKFDQLLLREIDRIADRRRQEIAEQTGGSPTDEELYDYVENKRQSLENAVGKKMKRLVYNWKPTNFKTKVRCMTYVLARFSADYSILCRIFNEIRRREPDFCPKSVFDFGSGVGSTIWASEKIWPASSSNENVGNDEHENFEENFGLSNRRTYFCVDVSSHMIDLCSALLRDGDPCGPMTFQNADVHFRQFLPATNDPKYNLVVSAFSMLEIPTYDERMRIATNLWQKTDDFLVFVENGNRYGFTVLAEIRDHILAGGRQIWRKELKRLLLEGGENSSQQNLLNNLNGVEESILDEIFKRKDLDEQGKFLAIKEYLTDKLLSSTSSSNSSPSADSNNSSSLEETREFLKNLQPPTLLPLGHMFAPCPHDYQCPRLRDVLPCKFEQSFFDLQLKDTKSMGEARRETFSYLILRKGARPNVQAESSASHHEWPRLVRPVLHRKNHSLCEMCTKDGFLSEFTSTKGNSGSHAYNLIRAGDWGDLLPLKLDFSPERFEAMRERFLKFKQKELEEQEESVKKNVTKDSSKNQKFAISRSSKSDTINNQELADEELLDDEEILEGFGEEQEEEEEKYEKLEKEQRGNC